MIFRQNEKMDFPLILVLIATIVLLIVGVVVFSKHITKKNIDTTSNTENLIYQSGPTGSNTTISQEELLATYKQGIQDQLTQIESAKNAAQVLTAAEALLLDIRVPQPYLEQHLAAVIAVRSLIQNDPAQSDADRLNALKNAFQTLLESIK